MKRYAQYMDEISNNQLYVGLLSGMFSDRLPPIFSIDDFLEKYASRQHNRKCPSPLKSRYVSFDSIRNTGIPRHMGIPSPFSYEILCRFLMGQWSNIRKYFNERTASQTYKISQIHIRKIAKTSKIFEMNYANRHISEDVVPNIRLSARFCVEADISTCFPSIYTHAIEWAITSRARAKDNLKKHRKEWGGELDEYVRSLRDNETGGILIGPHASNLISEIILTRIDEILYKNNYSFIRTIDDYTCYVDTYDKAERFLSDLKDALAEYNLSLNYKKVAIKELPLCVDDTWKQQLRSALLMLASEKIGKEAIATFLDVLVGIMKEHKNGAVFSYAVKAVSKRFLTEEARQYYVKFILHLAYCYPYLYQYLDEYLFYSFDVEISDIALFANQMFNHGCIVRNFEESSYALFFAIKYDFELRDFNADSVIETKDCILQSIAWQYVSCRGLSKEKELLHKYALTLLDEASFEENWIFVYEALTANELSGDWKILKKMNVSFFQRVENIYPLHTPTFEKIPILWSCRIKPAECKVYTDLYQEFVNENMNRVNHPLADEYLQCIVGNLLANSRLKKNVQIYRNQLHYLNSKPFGKNGERHDVKVLNAVLDWLKAKHYIGERRGTPTIGGSCFWPKTDLRDKFNVLNLNMLYRLDESPLVVLKDRQKNIVEPLPKSAKRCRYEQQLLLINDVYGKHNFSCKLYGMRTQDIFEPRLKAVFNDYSWEHGGRLYASATLTGFNYQCVPSDMRKNIMIDGSTTVEVDYSGLHPHMLYAFLGKPINGNAYDFLPVEDKALAKFALLVMLNAKSKQAAIAALKKRTAELRTATGLSIKKAALRNALLHHPDFEKVLDAASKKHSAIRTYFYRGSGIRLQNIESAMALEIVHYFALQDIPVLPVHDSFIVSKQFRSQLYAKMDEVYKYYNKGFSCPIK